MTKQTSYSLLLISILICVPFGSSHCQAQQISAGFTIPNLQNLIDKATAKSTHCGVGNDACGEKLFAKKWEPGESLYEGADGVGPLFNDNSCLACHSQAGVGGGSGIDKNVDILSLATRATPKQKNQLSQFHPGFRDSRGRFLNNIVLHRFGLDQIEFKTVYSKEREKLMGNVVSLDRSEMNVAELQENLETKPIREVTAPGGVPLVHSQRNSPALFGAGLIDKIPDVAIAAEAVRQAKKGKVSGRASQIRLPIAGGTRFAVGKFGWRAQQATLHDFVEGACAVELGLNLSLIHI